MLFILIESAYIAVCSNDAKINNPIWIYEFEKYQFCKTMQLIYAQKIRKMVTVIVPFVVKKVNYYGRNLLFDKLSVPFH